MLEKKTSKNEFLCTYLRELLTGVKSVLTEKILQIY